MKVYHKEEIITELMTETLIPCEEQDFEMKEEL